MSLSDEEFEQALQESVGRLQNRLGRELNEDEATAVVDVVMRQDERGRAVDADRAYRVAYGLDNLQKMLGDREVTSVELRAMDEEREAMAERGEDPTDSVTAYLRAFPDAPLYDLDTEGGRIEWATQRFQDAERAAEDERRASADAEQPERWSDSYDRTTADGINEFAKEAARRVEEAQRQAAQPEAA